MYSIVFKLFILGSVLIIFCSCSKKRGKRQVSALKADNYGKRLAGQDNIWWCSSMHKVSKTRPLPSSDSISSFVSVKLARNEYEAVQVIIRPEKNIKNITVRTSDLVGPNNNKIQASDVTIDRVGYVHIKFPSDSTGMAGIWPDPLPSIKKPLTLSAKINQPFWITVYAPKGISGGLYKGALYFSGEDWQRKVPIHVKVWNFTLSDKRHIRTALGLSAGLISKYQHVSGEKFQEVLQKYYKDFDEHRISPYNFVYGSGIYVDWGLNVKKSKNGVSQKLTITPQQVKVDFTAFDKAMEKALSNYHFNTFRLAIKGTGYRSHGYYHVGKIGPYIQGSPQYDMLFGSYLKQLQNHLAKKGWLNMAYLYWYDEPAKHDYAAIKQMGDIIHRYAPKLKWMLTEQIEKKLVNSVNIWCPLLDNYNHKIAIRRQKRGDEVWWYICTVPKAPYIGEFIDRPAIDSRLWLWQTWKNDVSGILIWRTNYWTSSSTYPDSLQNPWKDPESWTSSGSPDSKWGNGDGRFLYPPNHHPNNGDNKPIMSGPVNSIRWELLRDGIEDYEYFWTLQQEVNKMQDVENLNNSQKNWLRRAKNLLAIPDSITKSLTNYSKNPLHLMEYRAKVASTIVKGKKLNM